MKKIILYPALPLLVLFLLAFSSVSFAQDDIIMRNDDVVKAKVEEVGINTIRYHKADNPDGPIYDLAKSDVYMIVYANGSRDVINPRSGGDAPPPTAVVPADEANVRVAPPEMPVYEQPMCPAEGYLWTPGYWAYGILGYYWVPGVWVAPPHPNYLWTPGYWGYDNGYYGWHDGYWGEHVGFYGGVCYGYGYGGSGYYGGRWEGGSFRYNTAVCRVDMTVVHTTYVDNSVVVNNTVVNHSSFNGQGGVVAVATPQERVAMRETHVNPTAEQVSHVSAARNDRSQYQSENHGHPATTAMDKPNGRRITPEGHENTAPRQPVSNAGAHNEPAGAHNNGASHNEPAGATHNNGGTHNEPAGATHSNNGATHNEPAGGTHNNGSNGGATHGTPANNGQHNTGNSGAKPAPKPQSHPAPAPKPAEEHH